MADLQWFGQSFQHINDVTDKYVQRTFKTVQTVVDIRKSNFKESLFKPLLYYGPNFLRYLYMYNLYNSINSTPRDSWEITFELDFCN